MQNDRYCVISCLVTQGYFGLVTEQTDSWTLHVYLMGAVFRATACDLANVLDQKLHNSITETLDECKDTKAQSSSGRCLCERFLEFTQEGSMYSKPYAHYHLLTILALSRLICGCSD